MIVHITILGPCPKPFKILKMASKKAAIPFQIHVQVMVFIFVRLYKYKSIFLSTHAFTLFKN